MAKTIHPKTGGAAIGGAVGVLLVAIANSIHHVHIPGGVADAFLALLPIVGAYLTPSPDTPAAAVQRAGGKPQPMNQGVEVRALDPWDVKPPAWSELKVDPPPAATPGVPTVVHHAGGGATTITAEQLANLQHLVAKLSGDA